MHALRLATHREPSHNLAAFFFEVASVPFRASSAVCDVVGPWQVGDVPVLAEGGPPLRDAIESTIKRLMAEAQAGAGT